MNYILILLEVIFTFFLMFIFYKVGKKNGLYLYIVLMSSIASIIMFKTIDLFSFQVNLGIPIIMGLFICNNIIIQRFGIDEVKRIMTTSGIAYVVVGIIVSLLSLTINGDYVLTSNEVFNSLFGYDINNIRIFIGGFVSIMLMLWSSSYVYYYIRRNNNSITYQYIENMYERGWEIHSLLESFLEDMNFYSNENAYVLYGNHLTGAFSAFLNLYHDNCKLTSKEKREYIRRIIDRPYVKKCAVNRKSDKGIIGLTSFLVRMNNTLLISAAFKGISLARKVKA